ncbi:hypothetical protein BX600DRAFT_444091 [Xylariales sp. PMI_506]|nr:hypothetical protein BX600DRAFT_444091 [Xylariales sp. PMI_506]
MPFPSEPITLRGGCQCGAVRWRMALPERSERARHVYFTPGSEAADVRLPSAVVCHCDSCRLAVGSIGAYGLTTDMATLELSVLPRTTIPNTSNRSDETRPAPYISSLELIDEKDTADISGLWLAHYESSPGRNRWFCGRCGSQLGMSAAKAALPPMFLSPRIMNLWGASMDRDLLEKEWARPDHIMQCATAIPWVRRYVQGGAKEAEEHPFIFLDWQMKDDIRPHIEGLKQAGIDLNVTMWE